MDRLKGKVALISGGARGQGAAEARLFVSEGAKVVIGDVLDDQCRKTAADINASGSARSVISLHLDVTRASDWRAAVETCQREFGGLDILVNNAGIITGGGIEETTEEDWDSVVNINQKGMARDEACGAGDAPAGRRLDHQYLVNLRSDWLWRFRRLSRHQGRRSPPH